MSLSKQELLNHLIKLRLELIRDNVYNGGLDNTIKELEVYDKETNEENQT